jgi:nucleotide-binding universal stress UspA family protein
MNHLKTILVSTDFSNASRYALDVACALARDQAARVILLHVLPSPAVVEIPDTPAFKAEHTEEDLQAYRNEMSGLLAKAREQAPYANVEPVLAEGDVANMILRTARESSCDLIVMGAQARSRMHQLMLGSVTVAVSREAPCPLLTVKLPTA